MRVLVKPVLLAIMLTVFSVSLSVCSEENPKYPSEADIVDITDKVMIRDGDTLKFSEWHFDKELPPLLSDAAEASKAKAEWDSYPNGAKLPVKNFAYLSGFSTYEGAMEELGKTFYSRHLYPEMDDFAAIDSFLSTCNASREQSPLGKYSDRPEMNFDGWEPIAKHIKFWTCIEPLKTIIPEIHSRFSIPVGVDTYLFLKVMISDYAASPPPYVHPILSTVTADFSVTPAKVECGNRFPDRDFVTSWGREPYSGYENHQSYNYFLLSNRKTGDLELYGEDAKLIKVVKLFPKKYSDTNIWHCPTTMLPRTYPHVLVFEDNWGFNRNLNLPPFRDTSMHPSPMGSKWWPFFIPSDKPARRTLVYNVLTEKVEWEISGLFSVELIASDLIRVPNVVKNGHMGYSLLNLTGECAFIPYGSFISQDYIQFLDATAQATDRSAYLECRSPYAYSDLVIGSNSFSLVDYKDKVLKRPILAAPLDTESFLPENTRIIVTTTKEYQSDGVACRDFLLLSGREATHPFQILKRITVPVQITGEVKGTCFAWMTKRGLEIMVNGKVSLVRGVLE